MPEAIYSGELDLHGNPVEVDPMGMASLGHALPNAEELLEELMNMVASVRNFYRMQPDQVMLYTSAYSARLTELAMRLQRRETVERQYTRMRTQQVERLQEELERQFKIASRMVEIARQDSELMGRS